MEQMTGLMNGINKLTGNNINFYIKTIIYLQKEYALNLIFPE